MVWWAWAQRAERHGGSDEAAHDRGSGLHLVKGQGSCGGTDLQQIAQHSRFALDGQSTEGIPGLNCRQAGCSRTAGAPGYDLQSLDGLRLPEVRLGVFVFAEADPAVVRKGFGYRLLGSGCGRLRLLVSGVDQGGLAGILVLSGRPEVAQSGLELGKADTGDG